MTLTRWKLMAGGLGLSIAGVVAMAGPQCPNTSKDATRETAPPPTPVVAAKKELPAKPTPAPMPVLPLVESPPALPAVAVAPKLELPPPEVKPAPTPTLDVPALSPLPPVAGSPLPDVALKTDPPKVELPKSEPAPPKPDRVVELPLPGVTAPKPVAPVVDLPTVKETKPPVELTPPAVAVEKPAPAPRVLLDEPPPAPLPKAEPKKVEATPTKVTKPATSEEAAVRIVIHLGTGQPKFDVMAGDDALLKAVCNNIDIRSPTENGAGVTPLKAGGKVQFSAPGCEGTCDSLTVLPTTGEVELSGNVKVHTRLGKGSTEINATTMKFKLGSAPAYSVPEPGVTPAAGRQ